MPNESVAPPEKSGRIFTERADFARATITERVNFAGATFTERAYFPGAIFTQWADFAGATFTKEATFAGATFTRSAKFERATFTEEANFEGAIFTQWANFAGAIFTKEATFAGATFTEGANFAGAIFAQWANFAGATFTQGADFAGAAFTEGASFVNSEMKSETTFERASFLRTPPLFDGAKLHEGTTWFDVTWPRSPKTKEDARFTVRAYERLKLEMDKLKKHEDELLFFALELQARRVLAGKWSTSQGLAIGVYGCLCEYGRSYSRPIWLLVALSVFGAAPFLAHFGWPEWQGSLALSAANTFGILGFRREFFPATFVSHLPRMLKFFSAIQTVAGAMLFFLFGVGLRNRFRMR